MSLKDSVQSLIWAATSTSMRLSSSFPFSYFLKSRIWLMRRIRMRTFFIAKAMSLCCPSVRLSARAICDTGSAISVSGVRKSWETLVKNVSFDCVACRSCSIIWLISSFFCCSCTYWRSISSRCASSFAFCCSARVRCRRCARQPRNNKKRDMLDNASMLTMP